MRCHAKLAAVRSLIGPPRLGSRDVRWISDPAGAGDHLRRAEALVAKGGDTPELARALLRHGQEFVREAAHRRRPRCRAARDGDCGPLASKRSLGRGCLRACMESHVQRPLGEALALAETAWQTADREDDDGAAFTATYAGTALYFGLHDFKEAMRWAQRELGKPRTAQSPFRRESIAQLMSNNAARLGDLTEARRLSPHSDRRFFRASLLLFEGQWEEAEELFQSEIVESRSVGNLLEVSNCTLDTRDPSACPRRGAASFVGARRGRDGDWRSKCEERDADAARVEPGPRRARAIRCRRAGAGAMPRNCSGGRGLARYVGRRRARGGSPRSGPRPIPGGRSRIRHGALDLLPLQRAVGGSRHARVLGERARRGGRSRAGGREVRRRDRGLPAHRRARALDRARDVHARARRRGSGIRGFCFGIGDRPTPVFRDAALQRRLLDRQRRWDHRPPEGHEGPALHRAASASPRGGAARARSGRAGSTMETCGRVGNQDQAWACPSSMRRQEVRTAAA